MLESIHLSRETNAQFAQIVSPNETIALVTIGGHWGLNGMINCCIPHILIEPILDNLNLQVLVSRKIQNFRTVLLQITGRNIEKQHYGLEVLEIPPLPLRIFLNLR